MGYPGPLARPDSQLGRQPIEPIAVPNIPALVPRQGFRKSPGSLAILAAIRRALVGCTLGASQELRPVRLSLWTSPGFGWGFLLSALTAQHAKF